MSLSMKNGLQKTPAIAKRTGRLTTVPSSMDDSTYCGGMLEARHFRSATTVGAGKHPIQYVLEVNPFINFGPWIDQ